MTCIIGLEDKGKVYIGGDSAASNAYSIHQMVDPKVFRVGPFLIGSCGSIRLAQLLHHNPPDIPVQMDESDMQYLVRSFVEPIREHLKANGLAKTDKNEEAGGLFLVGYKGRIYKAQDDYSIYASQRGLFAIGCGEDLAYGAMLALKDLSPKKRIRQALKIAAHMSPHVAGPFVIEKL